MSFQIIDVTGTPLPIIELDKQACEVWNQEVHPKKYASPNKPIPKGITIQEELILLRNQKPNWFDHIGYIIHRHNCDYWDDVINHIIPSSSIGYNKNDETRMFEKRSDEQLLEFIKHFIEYYQPYIDLINHWIKLGYKPRPIKD